VKSHLHKAVCAQRQAALLCTQSTQSCKRCLHVQVPPVFGIDSMHGANYVHGAPMFPHMLHVAASFEPEHAYAAARSGARHTRGAGIDWVFAPVCDVAVTSRFPRVYESGGEDPRVSGVFAAAIVQGLQGMPLRTARLRRVPAAEQPRDERAAPAPAPIPDDLSEPDVVAACMKHFIGCAPRRVILRLRQQRNCAATSMAQHAPEHADPVGGYHR
jgi:beta-glucosidase-like glycosyl hydrolase